MRHAVVALRVQTHQVPLVPGGLLLAGGDEADLRAGAAAACQA